jgi:spermidine synthase
MKHGIDTTIVELDPVVYKFATQYFNLPANHIAAIEDATKFVKRAQSKAQQYDYIVHDVFTGGAEPAELFTVEFLEGLNALLKDDGVIAIVS